MTGERVRRVDFNPTDWLTGTQRLTNEQRGLYINICCLIWAHGGAIDEDYRWLAAACNCSVRKARAVVAELVEARKLAVTDAKIHQKRAEEELEKAQKRIKNAAKAASVRWENNDLGDADGHAGPETDADPNHQPPTTSIDDDDGNARACARGDAGQQARCIEPSAEARAIVEAFDASLFEHFEIRRVAPQPFDGIHAQRWLDAGATVPFCTEVIRGVHAKLVTGGYPPPRQLAYHHQDISRAMGEARKTLETHDDDGRTHDRQHHGKPRGGRGTADGFIAALDRAATAEPGLRTVAAAAGSD